MATVTLDAIKKVYDNDFVAVHESSFQVDDGEFVVLVGPSGCGKSTTLRMIAGLESISGGNLFIGDRRVNDVEPKDRDIAMVFQNYALYPHMTVYDNMAFGLKLRKFSKQEIDQRVRHASDILGLTPILDRKPKQLSGGQRQRVAVGRAIVRQPQVFLFDEPLSNLDAKLRVQMRTEISKLHSQLEATMIYVTHDQVEAMTMGDRIVVMKDGFVQQIAAPLHLYNHPVNKFVGGFIGSPSMNFIEGRMVMEEGLHFVGEGNTVRIKPAKADADLLATYANKRVVLGVRPENLALVAPEDEERAPIRIDVEVVEPMGNEIFLYGRSGEQSIVARVTPEHELHPKQSIEAYLDLHKLHYFDAETEMSIRPQPTAIAA